MDKAFFMNFLAGLVDQGWKTAIGPAVTVMITATANKLMIAYIPRFLQIPLAGIMSAFAAGLAGGDIAQAAAAGSLVQGAISMNAETFLASAPVPKVDVPKVP